MRRLVIVSLALAALAGSAQAADSSKVKGATDQVERGAGQIGRGEVGPGVSETAKGIGNTVVEGAKFTGDKLKESGQAAETPARSAWDKVKGATYDFGQSVKRFFTRLTSD